MHKIDQLGRHSRWSAMLNSHYQFSAGTGYASFVFAMSLNPFACLLGRLELCLLSSIVYQFECQKIETYSPTTSLHRSNGLQKHFFHSISTSTSTCDTESQQRKQTINRRFLHPETKRFPTSDYDYSAGRDRYQSTSH